MANKYILKSLGSGVNNLLNKTQHNIIQLSSIGIKWDRNLIKQSKSVGIQEANVNNNYSLYDINDYNLADYSNDNKFIAFFDKSYPLRRDFLRRFAMNGEIELVIETIADETIVLDESNYFAYPDVRQLKTIIKDNEAGKQIVDDINESFRRVYHLYGFNDSHDAWHYLKKFLIDGFLSFEIIFNTNEYGNATEIIGFKEIDPVSLQPEIRMDENGNEIKVWIQYKDDPDKERVLLDSNLIYISWAKGNFISRLSYVERLVRSFNMLRTMENSRIIWNVQNAQKRIKITVPIGTQSEQQARTRLKQLEAYYKEDVTMDDQSGELSVNGQPKFSFAKTYVFPSKNGEHSDIEEIGVEGYDLNNTEQLKYFWQRFVIETKIPKDRFSMDLGDSGGQTGIVGDQSITREEYRFAQFINRIRSIFQEILIKPTWVQFCLKNPRLANNNILKGALGLLYNEENLFTLAKERSIAEQGAQTVSSLSQIQDAKGNPYFSIKWLTEKYLGLTPEDFALNAKYKEQEDKQREKSSENSDYEGGGGFTNFGNSGFGEESPGGGFGEESFGDTDAGPTTMGAETPPSAE